MGTPSEHEMEMRGSNVMRTIREKGSFRSSKSVLFWYLLISLSATVPGLYRRFLTTWPVAAAACTRVRT